MATLFSKTIRVSEVELEIVAEVTTKGNFRLFRFSAKPKENLTGEDSRHGKIAQLAASNKALGALAPIFDREDCLSIEMKPGQVDVAPTKRFTANEFAKIIQETFPS